MHIIYFLVSIIATTIGAGAGIGGGIIIKPVIDSVSNFSLGTINFLSSATILSMAIISIIKQLMQKDKIDIKNTFILSIGSIIGGVIGQKILRFMIEKNHNTSGINIFQSVCLIFLLAFVYFYMKNEKKLKKFKLNNIIIVLIIGVFLGGIAAFLGIGGGPINVAILSICFSMEAKEAARNSIIIILFSQGAKIISIACTTGFAIYNLSALPVMLIGGVLGGFLGYKLNKTISEKNMMKIFNAVLFIIILINIYNIIKCI